MSDQHTTDSFLPDEQGVSSADGSAAVADLESLTELDLESLNKALGKEFKDVPTALKSIKDTFNFVGKAGNYRSTMETLTKTLGLSEDEVLKSMITNAGSAAKDTAPTKAAKKEDAQYLTREQYETDMFFAKNGDLEPHRTVLEALAKAKGVSVQEAASSDDFKPIFEKVKGFEEIQSKRTVLESNPRLGSVTNKLDEARKADEVSRAAARSGDHRSAMKAHQVAKRQAVDAVLESLES